MNDIRFAGNIVSLATRNCQGNGVIEMIDFDDAMDIIIPLIVIEGFVLGNILIIGLLLNGIGVI